MTNPPVTMKNSSSQTQPKGKTLPTAPIVKSRREYKELVNGRSVCSSSSVSENHGKSLQKSTTVTKSTVLKRITTSVDSSGKSCDDNETANILRQGSIRNKSSAIITAKNKVEMMRHSRSVVSTSLSERGGGREKGVGGAHAVKLPLPCVNDQYGSVPLCSKLAHESKSNSKTESYSHHRKPFSTSTRCSTNYQRAQMSVTNPADKSSVSIEKLSVSRRNEPASISNDKTRILKRQFAVRVNSNESEQNDSHSQSLNKLAHCKIQLQSKNNISLRKMPKKTESNNNTVSKNCCNKVLASTNVETNTRKRLICNKSPTMSPTSPLSVSRPIIQSTSIQLTATKTQPPKQQNSLTDKSRSNKIISSQPIIKCKDFAAKLDISDRKGRETALVSSSVGVQRKAVNKNRKMTTSSSTSGSARKKGLKILKPMDSYMQICEGTELELSVQIEGTGELRAKEVVWVKDDTIIKHLPPDFVYAKETIVRSSGDIFTLKIADTFVEDSGIYICEAYGVEKDDDVISWCRVDVIVMDQNGVGSFSLEEKAITPQFKAPSLPLVNSEALVVCQELALDLSAQDLSECKDLEQSVQVQVKTPCLPIDNSEALAVCQEQVFDDTSAEDLSEECREFEKSVQVQIAPISPLTFHPNKDFDIVPQACNDVQDSSNSCQFTRKIRSHESATSAKEPKEEVSLLTESDVITMAQEACLAQEIAIAGKQEECIPLERNQILSISPAQAPKIVMGPTNLIALFGETIHLRVKMHCFDMCNTTVTWSKFYHGSYKVIVDNAEPYKDDITTGKKKISTNNEITTLTLGKISYDDSGKYLVNIANGAGDDSHVCILTVEGPPVPPTSPPDVKYNIVTNTILVAWAGSPYDGGSAVTGYYVEVSIKSSGSNKTCEIDTWTLLTPQSGNWLCYTVSEPTPNASYKFRIRAVNAYGKGEPTTSSEELFISDNSDSNSSYRSGSRQSSLQNYCSEVDDEDRSESDVTFREYINVDMKCDVFLDHYEKHEELGKGRFGVVFRVVQKNNGESYAGKFIKCIKSKDKERVHLEFNIMNDLKYHPKLLCLIDGFEMSREIVIITERINGGELFERVVADDFTLTEHDCIDFLRQICAGVEYIHAKNIMHLDLKPENILCTTKTSNLIKIIDFGLAQYYNPEDPIRVLFGTAEFVAPEIINYDTICPSADMWSIGVITYILLSGLSPFMGDNDNETFSNITIGEFDFDDDSFENVSEDAKDFISSLIVKRKEKRLTAKECLEHKWLIQCSDVERKDIIIPTDKLKRFLVRRKWQKTGNAIRALGRITTLYSSRRSSSASSTTSSPSYSPLMRSFSTQESTDNDSVFLNNFHPAVSPLSVPLGKDKRISPICEGTVTKSNGINDSTTELDDCITNNKPKYNESCRSDSGICDVVGP